MLLILFGFVAVDRLMEWIEGKLQACLCLCIIYLHGATYTGSQHVYFSKKQNGVFLGGEGKGFGIDFFLKKKNVSNPA